MLNHFQYIARPWFSLKRYPVPFIANDCECNTAQYSLQADGSVRVQNCCQILNDGEEEDVKRCSIGQAVISFPDQNPLQGRLNVSFNRRECFLIFLRIEG